MRIIVFITEVPAVRQILMLLGEPNSSPRLMPARSALLCEMLDAGKHRFDPRPSQRRITNSISAWRGENSLTRI
jgi:hypothetical protein